VWNKIRESEFEFSSKFADVISFSYAKYFEFPSVGTLILFASLAKLHRNPTIMELEPVSGKSFSLSIESPRDDC
jgi:hypothetical protein